MTAARYLCLLAPAALVLLAARADRSRDGRLAALLAGIAAAVGIAALHELSRLAGWFSFAPVDGAFRGMPVDLWLGWAALWGVVPVLLRRVLPLSAALGLLLWLDAVAMPELQPLVRLGPDWLVGEAVGLILVALPAQLLGRWSADRRHLRARAALQLVVFAALTLWLGPTAVFEYGDGSWAHLTRLPGEVLILLAQVGLLVAVPALAAVREFVVRGHGTPYPWDPPRRLVTTGPYAYLANPMQLGGIGLVLVLAVATRSAWLAVSALAAVAFATSVAGPHERRDLAERYGAAWCAYRSQVRAWWPRGRPYPAPVSNVTSAGSGPAVLWLDAECAMCRAVGAFLRARRPRQLVMLPAGEHHPTLWRARYVAGDGYAAAGVAAIAHALDHLHLGWAYLGWLLRLPGVAWLAQLIADAMIAPPHPAGGVGRIGRPGAVERPGPVGRGEGCRRPSSDSRPSSGSSTARSRPSASTASPGSPPGP